jgi:hypothetical protein
MLAALTVTVIGVGIAVAGAWLSALYDIGIMVTFLGVIGILVRLVGWLRWLRG